ncbi:phosphatidate cytidylyltransferase [Mesomycoplasma neurolyticum]|uniref:Phosphatidate cytidylyltransferase n=1 Tax=Mesomycoplasma neurolyticum TaxID=2120 RepID=A0A449A6F4_9BACT|nr:phosphatidate cytidylyltransferase [Mesomycoplasma neurolyticum]VEU59816.1 Phosphatidate cytidylyltransferase [Mesomycoplasma neurolyticum]
MVIKTHSNIFKRLLIVFVIFAIFLPIFFLTLLGKVGNIIFSILCIILTFYALFEILQHFHKNKILTTIFCFLSILFFIKRNNIFSFSQEILLHKNNETEKIKKYIEYLKFDWEEFLCIALLILVVTIIYFIKEKKTKNIFLKKLVFLNFIVIFIPVVAEVIILTNIYNVYLSLALIFISAFADSAGYFGGKLLGNKIIKRKLAPKISPKKTWEGFVFAYLFSFIFGFCIFYFSPFLNTFSNKILISLVFSLILPLASIFGDLFFSLIKRFLKIKDFSKIFKNHGGFMDRFDSTFFVFFIVFILFIIFSLMLL